MVIDEVYKGEMRSWLGDINFINPFAITLTLKSSNFRENNQNIRHFLNRLNQSYLQNSYRRYKKRLTVVVASEGNGDIRNHHHLIIDNPYIERDGEFVRKVKDSWVRTELGLRKIEIEKMSSDGWIKYITKFKSKPSYKDSFDFDNFQTAPLLKNKEEYLSYISELLDFVKARNQRILNSTTKGE